jgi:hypothetical protein
MVLLFNSLWTQNQDEGIKNVLQNENVDTKWTKNNCGHKNRTWAKIVDTKWKCGHKSGWCAVKMWTQNGNVDTKIGQKPRKTAIFEEIFSMPNIY